MTTARTHRRNVGRGGAARPRVAEPTPDGFTAIAAESFGVVEIDIVGAAESFDPADHNVEDVKAYVTDNPEQAEAILELEVNGKARSGLISFLENFTESEG